MPVKRIQYPTPWLVPPSAANRGASYEISSNGAGYGLRYENPNGRLYEGDCRSWLYSLEPASVDLIFADPPYNISKADWDTFKSQDAYVRWSMEWIAPAARALKPTGSMYVCGFSEILADIRLPASRYFQGCRWIVWHYRNKANLGNDWGRAHESILHLRKTKQFRLNVDDVRVPYSNHTIKYPSHPQAITSQYGNGNGREHWIPNPLGAKPRDVIEIPTTCNGMGEKTPHPTQKPEALLRTLVLAASAESDLVVDPFSGSGTTLVVAEQLRRKWMGCDLDATYNGWAVERIESVIRRPVDYWLNKDLDTSAKRESIR